MIYLIHFSEPLAHARHYIGFVDGDAVTMFDTARGRQVIGLGGAHAWKCYERLAEEFPEINHHFRQPPSPPPPNVLFPTA